MNDDWYACDYPGIRGVCSVCGEDTRLCETEEIITEDCLVLCEECADERESKDGKV